MTWKYIFLIAIQFIQTSQVVAQDKFWIQTNGPTGGRITAITNSKGKIYCGTFGGNIFQSSDSGQSWTQIGLDETHNNVTSVLISPNGYIYFASDVDGVYKGTGKNRDWKRINNGLPNLQVTSLAVLPDGVLFAGTKAGLYRSINDGDIWMKVEKLNKPINIIKAHKHNLCVISTDSLFYYSSDYGNSWQLRKSADAISISAISFGIDGSIYVGTHAGDVLHSTNEYDCKKIANFNYGITVLETDMKGNIYAGLGGPPFSTLGGSVYRIRPGREKPELMFKDQTNGIWCISVTEDNIFVGTNKGMYRSDDKGVSWLSAEAGLIAQRVHDIVINKHDELFVASYGGVFFSADNGKNWIEVNNGITDVGITDLAINSNGDLFAGTYASNIFRSTDNGRLWDKKNIGLPDGTWISMLAIDSRGIVFAATDKGIYRSKNNGDTWEAASKGLENSFHSAVFIDTSNVIYTGNQKGNVFRSEDGGDEWQRIPTNSQLNDDAAELATDSRNQLYFASTEKGIFKYSSVDHKWISLNNGLTNLTIRSFLINKQDVIFAGTGVPGGVMTHQKLSGDNFYVSKDKGQTWSLLNSGLDHPRVRAIAINSKGIIFAGTAGGGVYKSLHPLNTE